MIFFFVIVVYFSLESKTFANCQILFSFFSLFSSCHLPYFFPSLFLFLFYFVLVLSSLAAAFAVPACLFFFLPSFLFRLLSLTSFLDMSWVSFTCSSLIRSFLHSCLFSFFVPFSLLPSFVFHLLSSLPHFCYLILFLFHYITGFGILFFLNSLFLIS